MTRMTGVLRVTRRLQWGVVAILPNGRRLGPLYTSWHRIASAPGCAAYIYPGEPTRALVWTTRRQAQAWCREEERYQRDCDVQRPCRFRVVRVRETLTVLP